MTEQELEQYKYQKELIEFAKKEIDKFVNDERYKKYKDILDSLVDNIKNEIIILQNRPTQENKDRCLLLVGEINGYTNILDLPKQFTKRIENITKTLIKEHKPWKRMI